MHYNPTILSRIPNRISLTFGLLVCLCMSAYWLHTRTPIACGGLGDCVKYQAMADAFRTGHFGQIEAPFNTRVLTPLLASLIPLPVTQSFLIINTFAALLFVWACHGIARVLGLRNIEYIAILAWFFLHPLGFGYYHTVPESVDPLSHALIALATWAYLGRSPTLPALLLVGLLTKESFTFIGLLIIAAETLRLLFETEPKERWVSVRVISYALVLLVLYKILKHGVEHVLFPPSDGHSPSIKDTLVYFWNEALREPERFIVWTTAVLCVVGAFPSLWLCPWLFDRSANNVAATAYLGLGAAGFVSLGLLGGSDMSRIIFTGNLLVITALLKPVGATAAPVSSVSATLLLSLSIAWGYTYFVPTTLEYDFYITARLVPTLKVLGLAVTVIGVAAAVVLNERGRQAMSR